MGNEYPEEVIVDTMIYTVDRFRNNIVLFSPPKCPAYVRLPWIGSPSQLIADKVSSSVTLCFNAAMVRTIFTTRAAFCFIHKDVLPIFQLSNLIYKFQCCCNRTTSRDSKLLDSAICEHLNVINNCAVNYIDECFGVLLRARTKQHLIVLKALYILFYKPTLCKQNLKHSLTYTINMSVFF